MCVGGMQPRQFVVGSLIGILLLHFIALTAPFTFSWPGLTMFLVMVYITGCLGITLGFHRLLSHGSFKVPKVFTYLLTLFGCLAMQGGPIRWVATHRLHHKTADTPEDPHSPTQGFWWAHLVWNLYRHPKLVTEEDFKHFAPDLCRDPVFRFLDRYFVFLNIMFALLIFGIGYLIQGWKLALSLVAWGCALRTVYVWHITWLVNSATHLWGYHSYDTNDNSQNNWWVALLTFGEGWHNNHHANPQSARMGLAWQEIDMTYWVIRFLRKIGLAKRVIERRSATILAQKTTD